MMWGEGKQLQLVQNAAAQNLIGAGWLGLILPLCNQLSWLLVHFWTSK